MNRDKNKGFSYIGYSHNERTRKSKNKIQKPNKRRWRKTATWRLKPQGYKSTKDNKNQKRNKEVTREGLHSRKQWANKEKPTTWELSLSKTGTIAPLSKEKRPSKNWTPKL